MTFLTANYICFIIASETLMASLVTYLPKQRERLKLKYMNAKAALCAALLKGEVLNIKNCFQQIGLTNCPREISRMVEKPFGVEVSRTQMDGLSRYGQPVTWYDYRLNRTLHNAPGIEKMKAYVLEQLGNEPPKTDKEAKKLHQLEMFLAQ